MISRTNNIFTLLDEESEDDPNSLDRLTEIRKNFYLLVPKLDRAIMNDVWESWKNAMPCFPNQYSDKLEVIKKFVLNLNQKELIIYDSPPHHRYQYHQICELLRLEHKTLDIFADSNQHANHYDRHNDPNLRGIDGYKPIGCNRFIPCNNNGDNPRPINITPKTMIISKPDIWSWEFTTISNEQEQLNQSKLKERQSKLKERHSKHRYKHKFYK